MVNLLNEKESYFYGFMILDGHLRLNSRNRGVLSTEISIKDEDIIHQLKKVYDYKHTISVRERVTNFGKIKTIKLSYFSLEFRNAIQKVGYPVGKKDILNNLIPNVDFDEVAFLRSLFDADGSLGFTNKGEPYISIVISNESINKFILKHIEQSLGIIKKVNRNKRDNVYNLILKNEDAVNFIKYLKYDDNEISLVRKTKIANNILNWIRTVPKAPPRKRWSDFEDNYILNHTVNESVEFLGRTTSSIKTRLYRLNLKNH